jgi:hypothetical protein
MLDFVIPLSKSSHRLEQGRSPAPLRCINPLDVISIHEVTASSSSHNNTPLNPNKLDQFSVFSMKSPNTFFNIELQYFYL